jgi:hypothetical protein
MCLEFHWPLFMWHNIHLSSTNHSTSKWLLQGPLSLCRIPYRS